MSHGNEHGHGSEEPKMETSSFYNWVAVSCLAIFLLIAIFIQLPSDQDGNTRKEYTYISESTVVDIPEEINNGSHKFYLLAPNAVLKAKFKLGELYPEYPKNLLSRASGFVVRDDKGNTNIRPGTLYVTVTNVKSEDRLMGFGRCEYPDNCNIDFSDSSKEELPGLTNFAEIFRNSFFLLVCVVLIVMAYLFWERRKTSIEPKYWLEPWRKVHHTTSHGTGGGHHGDGAPIPVGFVFNFCFVLIFAVFTWGVLFFTDGFSTLYALIPFIGFGLHTYLISYNGFDVQNHTKKGMYAKDTKHEAMTYEEGKRWASKFSYIIGTPHGQGFEVLNEDLREISLQPKQPETAKLLFKGKKSAIIQQPVASTNVKAGATTAWLTKFHGGTLQDLDDRMIRIWWSCAALVAADMTLDEVMTVKTPVTINGEVQSVFKFNHEVDEKTRVIFKSMDIQMDWHSSMAQPQMQGDLAKAVELEGVILEAIAGVKKAFPSLGDAEVEKSARIWAKISTETYGTYGLDKNTLKEAVQIAHALMNKQP